MARHTIFASDRVPANWADNDSSLYTMGVGFSAPIGGWITAIRLYIIPDRPENGSYHRLWDSVQLWKLDGTPIRNQAITVVGTDAGWMEFPLDDPYQVTTDTEFYATMFASNVDFGRVTYAYEYFVFDNPVLEDLSGLVAWADGVEPHLNGVFGTGSVATFPVGSHNSAWYGIDVVMEDEIVTGDEPTWSEWNGTTESPLSVTGLWNGSTIDPIGTVEIT
jgi:hypothetical protein